MKIAKTAPESYDVMLTPAEIRIFTNAMNATLKGIGDWEYPTRMSATAAQIEEVIASLEATLK